MCNARCAWEHSSFFYHRYCQSEWTTLKLIKKHLRRKFKIQFAVQDTIILDSCLSCFTSFRSLFVTITMQVSSESEQEEIDDNEQAGRDCEQKSIDSAQTSASWCFPSLLKKKKSLGGLLCRKVIMQHFFPQELFSYAEK